MEIYSTLTSSYIKTHSLSKCNENLVEKHKIIKLAYSRIGLTHIHT